MLKRTSRKLSNLVGRGYYGDMIWVIKNYKIKIMPKIVEDKNLNVTDKKIFNTEWNDYVKRKRKTREDSE